MKRVLEAFVVLVFLSMGIWTTALAKRTQEGQAWLDRQTENFVKKAAVLVVERGRVTAACTFNDPKGHFQRGFQYIFAVTCGNHNEDDGFIVADPATPQYNYTNRKHKSPIIKQILQDSYGVLQHSEKWYDYCWINPATHEYHVKRSYVRMIPKAHLCIGSGYYLRKTCSPEK